MSLGWVIVGFAPKVLFLTALPSDVRRGFALPAIEGNERGSAPGTAFGPTLLEQSSNQGRSPPLLLRRTARQSLAAHQAANPKRTLTHDLQRSRCGVHSQVERTAGDMVEIVD